MAATNHALNSGPLLCLDTSVLLNIPRREEIREGAKARYVPYFPADEFLLDFYVSMCDMVEAQALIFPEEVERESRQDRKDDLARAFTQKAWTLADRRLRVPRDDLVGYVVAMAFREESANFDTPNADPRVIAIALTQREDRDRDVSVACDDKKMEQCCRDLRIPTLSTGEFIRVVLDWGEGTHTPA